MLAAAGVGFLALLVFLPSRHGTFLNWDDDALIVQNAEFRGLGWTQLRWMFSTTFMGHYQPLTWVSYALNFESGGLNPTGYLLTNVVLHCIAAVLVFALTSRILAITMPRIGAAVLILASMAGAWLFALHPLRVESVAWITERRDVLSSVFLLASVWAWLSYAMGRRQAHLWYIASVGLLLLSLLSKAWGMTLFAVLLVLDIYPLLRWSRGSAQRLLIEKLPFLILGVAAAARALMAQSSAVMAERERGWLYRALQSIYGLAFYPWKSLLPIGLSPIYEHPTQLSVSELRILAAIAAVIGITVVLFVLRHRWPAGLAAWAIYVIVISPVLGLVQAGPQFVADRYSYLACIPFVVLLAAGIAKLAARFGSKWVGGAVAATLIALVILTGRQIPVWRDSWSLWRAAIEHDPTSWNANSNLGSLYFKANDFPAAERHYRLAHDAVPHFALPTVNLAWCLGRMGKNDECLVLLRQASAMDSVSNNDMLMIANGLKALKQSGEAREMLERLIARDPRDGEAHFRLANLLNESGESDRAAEQFRIAIELLEPSILVGPIDLQHDLVAAMYARSCRSLAGLLAARGDAAGMEKYNAKLRAIEAAAIRPGNLQNR